MKKLFTALLIILTSTVGYAFEDRCTRAAEMAVYAAWYKPSEYNIGSVVAGGTDIVWRRGNVVSYQVSIQYRKPDSSTVNWANYSVRMRFEAGRCQVVKIRKF